MIRGEHERRGVGRQSNFEIGGGIPQKVGGGSIYVREFAGEYDWFRRLTFYLELQSRRKLSIAAESLQNRAGEATRVLDDHPDRIAIDNPYTEF